ncbi:diamine acetyltransferase 2-like isoform X2 [Varroa jacobsoni]|uniref:Uncharacterized protein n=1 Tax=Varroa destructor TaxID=109461 RepID=A0A7M7JPA4_VARDE|nr:diamine acetyltransferase 2-like isoform X2 [Varroa destructor]XP_022700832.1 diamine acetyltransferase 2-like isoform X2 [Varroa jacobsoni]
MASRSTNSSLIIEDATPDDAGTIIDLIKELAIYENMLDQVKLTAAELKADLSDKQPWGLKAKVAKLLGTTGIGMTLWRSVAQHGLEERCTQLQFAVLEWNKLGTDFYKKVGAFDRTLSYGVRLYRNNLTKTERKKAVLSALI